jgi:hypothetical protein
MFRFWHILFVKIELEECYFLPQHIYLYNQSDKFQNSHK